MTCTDKVDRNASQHCSWPLSVSSEKPINYGCDFMWHWNLPCYNKENERLQGRKPQVDVHKQYTCEGCIIECRNSYILRFGRFNQLKENMLVDFLSSLFCSGKPMNAWMNENHTRLDCILTAELIVIYMNFFICTFWPRIHFVLAGQHSLFMQQALVFIHFKLFY